MARHRRIRMVMVMLIWLMVGLLLPRAAGADPPDDAASRELVRYLLVAANGASGPPRNVDLFPQQLPGDLPLALPPPPMGRLIGSAVYHTPTETTSWDVLYETTADARGVTDFYERDLPPLGWPPPPAEDRPARGFAPAVSGTTGRGLYCTEGYALLVSSGETPFGSRYARVHVDTNAFGLCPNAANPPRPLLGDRLPALSPPPNVAVTPGSTSSSPTVAASAATAVTEMSVGDLEAFYAGQLTAAGWIRTAGSTDGPLAWSVWALPGDVQGFLSVLVAPGANRRSLSLQVQQAPAPANAPPPFIGPPAP